ncbi:MAG: hypothetical protein GEV05_24230 [Betaproteobacteria bacterium]|nr:hypothetical protein [Betaproteobacteria bacterium]
MVAIAALVMWAWELDPKPPHEKVDIGGGVSGWRLECGLRLDGRMALCAARQRRDPAVGKPLRWALAIGTAVFVIGAAVLTPQDIHFVFLNQGEDPVEVSRWLQAQGLPLQNVLIDELRQASAAFQQQGYPTTLFFDAKGSLVSRRIGELSAATLGEKLRQIPK